MPSSDILKVGVDSGWVLPFEVPAVWVPVVMCLPLSILIILFLNIDELQHRYGLHHEQGVSSAVISGFILGMFSIPVISLTGIQGVLIGTAASVCFILYFTSTAINRWGDVWPLAWKSFLTELTAVTVIWLSMTAIMGVVAGLLYALFALVVAAVVHFGIIGLLFALRAITKLFVRTMLVCNVE